MQTAIGRGEDTRPRARRRPPFFRTHWNETYGWHVAAIIGVLLACLLAFGAVAESVTEGDVITTWDARVNRWFHEHATQPLTGAVELFTHVGSGLWLVPLAAVAAGILAARRAWADALLVAMATAGALIINPLFKEFFSRPRPAIHDPDLTLRTFSFPSGHAMGSAAVYGALATVVARRLRGTPWASVVVAAAVVLVLLIGASRVYLGAHFPTDVVAGWILGLAWLLVCVLTVTIYERRRKAAET
jgi:undecaprenyl-diphosphatase